VVTRELVDELIKADFDRVRRQLAELDDLLRTELRLD
jgi:hypothetical protein